MIRHTLFHAVVAGLLAGSLCVRPAVAEPPRPNMEGLLIAILNSNSTLDEVEKAHKADYNVETVWATDEGGHYDVYFRFVEKMYPPSIGVAFVAGESRGQLDIQISRTTKFTSRGGFGGQGNPLKTLGAFSIKTGPIQESSSVDFEHKADLDLGLLVAVLNSSNAIQRIRAARKAGYNIESMIRDEKDGYFEVDLRFIEKSFPPTVGVTPRDNPDGHLRLEFYKTTSFTRPGDAVANPVKAVGTFETAKSQASAAPARPAGGGPGLLGLRPN